MPPSASGPRHGRRRRILRAAGRAALAAVVAAFAAAFAFGSETIRVLDRAETGYRNRLRDHLQGWHALAVYAPLDAGIPVNVASGQLLDAGETRVVAGRIGEARRFDADMRRSLGTDVRWNRFGARGGTISLWLDLKDTGRVQYIVWDRSTGVEMGLRLLADRTLEAVFTDGADIRAISAPLPPPGRFVPVAFVFSHERAALWIDGREVASAAVSNRLSLPSHPISFGPSTDHPLVGALDEISVWVRPLSADETAALASPSRTVAERLEPWRARRAAAARALASGFRTAARVLDRLVPSAGGPAVLRTDVPELGLVLSKKDERHFLAAHEASLRAGRRTSGAARNRTVLVDWAGADIPALLSLDDAYGPASLERADRVARPSFLLRGRPGDFGSRVGFARLVPPERFGAIHPDAPRPLPVGAGCFVRLLVDGDFRGLYVLEPFDAPGGGWRISGERGTQRPDHLLHGSLPGAGAPAGAALLSEAGIERRWRETLSLLRSDARFPWSGAEARWRARLHAERRAALAFGPPRLAAIDLAGGNPSPFYVTEDLDLAAAGPGVAWSSSDPAAIDAAGRVSRPAGDAPRVVELAGSFPDGTERTFRFRVMPEKPRLPALFLYVPDTVWKHRRTDFAAMRIPAGGGDPEVVPGTASTGGGLRHRGNTSYIHGSRRSLSLEFDDPVPWTGAPGPVSHVLLLSGYADATLLRNALCFEAFAAMRPDEPRGSVPVSWTDVFVNGEYTGVWETAPRLKDVVSGWASPVYKVRTPEGLWTRVSAGMLDRRDETPAGEDAYAPFLGLAGFVVGASDAEFAARAAEFFDLDELADMYLLLNFTGNMDGRVTNQFIVRRRSDGRWLVLPWDYDKTFRLSAKDRPFLLSNPLYKRCRALVPGFQGKIASRWAALRAGPLSDEALERWIDERSARLAPFVADPPRDDGAPRGNTYAEDVAILRDQVLFRARELDARLAADP